jgi:WXG100 family type VII secretion target
MATGIAVTPQRLLEISAQMSTGAADVQAILSRLSGNVAPVRSEWVGAAQAQFNALWDQLQKDANGLHSVLTGIAKLTENAATAYEAAELSITKAFDEFRIVPEAVHAVSGACEAAEVVAEIILDTESTPSLVLTEIDDGSDGIADESVDPQKANPRLPWTRFMTKAAHSTQNGEITIGPRVRERRFKASDPALKSGSRLCRLCFTVVILEPEYIERTATHVYVCCPHCERSFPIRHSDVEQYLLGQTPPSS